MKRKIVCLLCVCSVFSSLVGCTSQRQEIVVGELAAFEPAVAVKEDVDYGETTIVGESVIIGESVVSEEVQTTKIQEVEEQVTEAPATEVSSSAEELAANTQKLETISGDAGDSASEAATEEPIDDSDVISFGRYKGKVYINKYLKFGCNPPQNWTNASANDIYARNNIAAGLSQEEYNDFFEKTNVVVDLVSTRNDIPDTMTVNYNRLTGAALLVDEGTYLNIALNSMASQFTNMGFENVTAVKSVTNFLGKQHECIRVEGEREGTKAYEIVLYVKKGNHIASITACTWIEDKVDSLMDCFYNL